MSKPVRGVKATSILLLLFKVQPLIRVLTTKYECAIMVSCSHWGGGGGTLLLCGGAGRYGGTTCWKTAWRRWRACGPRACDKGSASSSWESRGWMLGASPESGSTSSLKGKSVCYDSSSISPVKRKGQNVYE